jgi:uncharacterized membrane protein YeiH
MQMKPATLLYAVDLAGTLLFGLEGASAAISGNLDFLGLLVLAFATALGGGIIRDLLIGSVPPNSLRDWHYSAMAFAGAAVTFLLHQFGRAIPAQPLMILDAAGLSLFAIAGTEKALLFKMTPLIAILLGGITGVGGGTIRDVLLARVPTVLQADVYATAALAGAATMVLCTRAGWRPTVSAFLGGSVCFALRVVSVWLHWNLPRVQ